MPEFIAEHVPSGLDEFLTGYLECAEWLLPEEEDGKLLDRSKVRGFTRKAIRSAKEDCEAFIKANAADLEAYEEITGRPMSHAGHDFWLTRNSHGAGFWDRGAGEVGERLSKAARVYGECNASVWRGWIYLD